jgi:glycosyltransferase involved in cell wall biosynthesis
MVVIVTGLGDSIRDMQTGISIKENSPDSLAQSAISLLKDKDVLSKHSFTALRFSAQFSWNTTADASDKDLKEKIVMLAYVCQYANQ